MWAKRAEQIGELHLTVPLEGSVVLDAADYLARQAALYGIRDHLELRRSPTGRLHDRHFVLCRPAGAPTRKPIWVLDLTIGRAANGDSRVDLGLHLYRRSMFGLEGASSAGQYRDLVREALRIATAERRNRGAKVIPLRPYARLAPSA